MFTSKKVISNKKKYFKILFYVKAVFSDYKNFLVILLGKHTSNVGILQW